MFADLQLAAELGRTLLERNKDLEIQLRTSLQTQQEHENEVKVYMTLQVLYRISSTECVLSIRQALILSQYNNYFHWSFLLGIKCPI